MRKLLIQLASFGFYSTATVYYTQELYRNDIVMTALLIVVLLLGICIICRD